MASQDTSIINLVGNVSDPTQMAQPDSSTPPFTSGRQGDLLTSEIHGKHYVANYRGKLFEANVANVIVPVVASALVSVFTLYNPVSSGVNMEIVSALCANVAATVVVNAVGWYYSTAVLTSKGSFATAGTVQSGMVGTRRQTKVSSTAPTPTAARRYCAMSSPATVRSPTPAPVWRTNFMTDN
jgi:hypothetical protein